MSFFEFINSQHPIYFRETELSFLDVLIDNSSHDCVFSVFHKKTYTGLLTIFLVLLRFAIKLVLSVHSLTELIKSTTLPPVLKTI